MGLTSCQLISCFRVKNIVRLERTEEDIVSSNLISVIYTFIMDVKLLQTCCTVSMMDKITPLSPFTAYTSAFLGYYMNVNISESLIPSFCVSVATAHPQGRVQRALRSVLIMNRFKKVCNH